MTLPPFRYHPDPIGTGSIVGSDAMCVCCGERRGYIYVGPVYSERELNDSLCPWCIADGSAHSRFGAEFTDAAGVGNHSRTVKVGTDVVEVVSCRTPGFSGWQQERWLVCCGDAAAFVGHAGHRELEARWPDAIESIKADSGLEGQPWENFYHHLNSEGSPTAYIFRCLHCQKHFGYQDCD
jgi:uncharacterized protein CbrC (UPF0167 family)